MALGAPVIVSVVDEPAQIEDGDALAVTVMAEFTVTVTVAVLWHPAADVPVTVYVVVAEGVTVTLVPVRLPGCQVQLGDPVAVSVDGVPEHTVAGDAVALITGTGSTVTVTVAVLVHPVGVVPVTVYVVVADGVTVTLVPVRLPGCHVHPVMPVAVSVDDAPAQMVAGDAEAVAAGELTVTVTVAVPVQPVAVVPVTVYVVVAEGDTVTEVPVRLPGCHVQLGAPVAVSVLVPPGHIVEGDAVAVITGAGVTVTDTTLLVTEPHALVTTAW